MSFMFKPLAFDDMNAVNKIKLDSTILQAVKQGNDAVAAAILEKINAGEKSTIVIDGYIGASFETLIDALLAEAKKRGLVLKAIPVSSAYKSEADLNELVSECLPLNYDEDPVLLFGKLYEGDIDSFFDSAKLTELCETIQASADIVVVYGHGSTIEPLRKLSTQVVYVDVTPKVTAIRAREERYTNIGTTKKVNFNALMRRNYFVDYEVVVKHRRDLLRRDLIDSYIIDNDQENMVFIPKTSFDVILDELVKYPFRAKPVYLEGIWGGEFIRKVRNLPMNIADKVAWIFEFIPMEVSIAVEAHGKYLDFPFSTFLHKEGQKILGESAYNKYQGYFPVRFNYDDTWHSDGNMSIQVHPGKEFNQKNYNELESQDEAYYVVATGHGAKTYAGFKKDGREFLELSKQSEKDGSMVPYEDYIGAIESVPGRQLMIPSGTIHASGRNQFILELGSLTIGSYTFKVYDYNRRDKEGKLRPIHSLNAEKILDFNRDETWVRENIAIDPVLVDQTADYREWIVGKTDLMYYETRRIEMKTHGQYIGANNGQFTVLTVVDGERVKIYAKDHPEFSYTANFLDIITVPAHIDEYIIEAQGYQPVVIHKTILRQD